METYGMKEHRDVPINAQQQKRHMHMGVNDVKASLDVCVFPLDHDHANNVPML